jgi:dynein heavy chain 1
MPRILFLFKNIYFIKVEEKLSVRLQAGLRAWTDHLEDYKEETSRPEFDSDTNPLVAHKPGGDPEIKVKNIIKRL